MTRDILSLPESKSTFQMRVCLKPVDSRSDSFKPTCVPETSNVSWLREARIHLQR